MTKKTSTPTKPPLKPGTSGVVEHHRHHRHRPQPVDLRPVAPAAARRPHSPSAAHRKDKRKPDADRHSQRRDQRRARRKQWHGPRPDPRRLPCPLTPRACPPRRPPPRRRHRPPRPRRLLPRPRRDLRRRGDGAVRRRLGHRRRQPGPPDQRDLLAPQGFAYTALELGPGRRDAAGDRRGPGRARRPRGPRRGPRGDGRPAASGSSRLTVTEKGYCHEPSTGRLNPDHPDIVHDLANPDAPRSAPGFLVARPRPPPRRRRRALHRALLRQPAGERPRGARRHARARPAASTPASPTGSRPRARFPSTMVDRIVPATKPEDIARLTALTGVLDLSPVMHEPFRQWVVEDDFVDGARPDLGAVGVQLVEDVTPFELMKLRMLNGTHSSLAYLGYLAGHETIADTVADPAFAGYVPPPLARRDHPDASPPPPGEDLGAYAEALFAALRQPGDPPPHLADRDGRLAEAAAAHPRHHRRRPRRRARRAPGLDARGRGLDALCRRRRREGRGRSTCATRWPARLRGALRRRGRRRQTGSRRCSGSREVFPAALAADPGFRADARRGARDARGRGRARRGRARRWMTTPPRRMIC